MSRSVPEVETGDVNVFQVTSSREEIALLFGDRQPAGENPEEVTARLKERIILSPLTAKRLAMMLDSGMRDYESRYGPLETESSPSTAREQMELLIRNPPFSKTDRIAEKAVLLLQRIKDLDIEVGYERSFKMFDKNLLGNRFLFGIKIDTIRERAHETILDICRELQMPANLLENFGKPS